LNGHWIAGFVSADGCFSIGLRKDEAMKFAVRVYYSFSVYQHDRDLQILNRILQQLGGSINPQHAGESALRISNMSDLVNVIIPFFIKYPLSGDKL